MDCRSPEALIRLMEVKSMEIEKKIQTLRQTRQYIDKKILITRGGQKASKYHTDTESSSAIHDNFRL